MRTPANVTVLSNGLVRSNDAQGAPIPELTGRLFQVRGRILLYANQDTEFCTCQDDVVTEISRTQFSLLLWSYGLEYSDLTAIVEDIVKCVIVCEPRHLPERVPIRREPTPEEKVAAYDALLEYLGMRRNTPVEPSDDSTENSVVDA